MEAEVKEVIKEKEYVHGDRDYYDYDRDRFASERCSWYVISAC